MFKRVYQFELFKNLFWSLMAGTVIFWYCGCNSTDHRNNYYGGMGEFSSDRSNYDETWNKAFSEVLIDKKMPRNSEREEKRSFFDLSFLGFKKQNNLNQRKQGADPLPTELTFEDRLCPIDQVDLTRSYDTNISGTITRPNRLIVTQNNEPGFNDKQIENISVPQRKTETESITQNITPAVSLPPTLEISPDKVIAAIQFPDPTTGVIGMTSASDQSNSSMVLPARQTASAAPIEINPIRQTAASQPIESNPIRQAGGLNSFETAPITPVSGEKKITWKEEAANAIVRLQKEIEKRKSEGENASEEELKLRLLYLAVDEHEKAIQEWKDVPSVMNNFWISECKGLTAFLNGSENKTDSRQITQAVAHFEKGIEELKGNEPIKIAKCLLAVSPAPFGLYTPRESAVKKGEVIHIYAELENVVNRTDKDGEHLALQCNWLLSDHQGNRISPQRTQHCRTRSASRLRDIVLNVSEEIPEKIEPGTYSLHLEIVDLQSEKKESGNQTAVDLPIIVIQ